MGDKPAHCGNYISNSLIIQGETNNAKLLTCGDQHQVGFYQKVICIKMSRKNQKDKN